MRRAGPALILLIGVLALIIDFFPGLRLPDFTGAEGGSRVVETKLGLDLKGGLRVEYQALPKDGVAPTHEALGVIKDIIERRVNTTGVSEPVVVVQGDDRVVIELPGISDVDSVRRLVGQTGRLDFVPLGTTPGHGRPGPRPEAVPAALQRRPARVGGGRARPAGRRPDGRLRAQGRRAQSGAQLFANYTADHVGQYFAIVLDGAVISAPVIKNAIPNGQVQISAGGIGGFPAKEANSLVTVLKFGSLPFPIKELSSEQISATLGEQFLNQSLLAGFIGIALVITFMLLYYRLPGLVALVRADLLHDRGPRDLPARSR